MQQVSEDEDRFLPLLSLEGRHDSENIAKHHLKSIKGDEHLIANSNTVYCLEILKFVCQIHTLQDTTTCTPK